MAATGKHKWTFARHFRRNAFGWKSQPAIARLKEAVSEIKKIERKDPLLAADGAVLLIEKISPALEHVDSSSGAIGSAVNRALDQLVAIISRAPADEDARDRWLDRLWAAYVADEIPYIEGLGDLWGDLCGSEATASAWADRLMEEAKAALAPGAAPRHFSQAAVPCLSALYRARRYAEIIEILRVEKFWSYKRWAVKALMAMGRGAEAIRTAESCRGPWAGDQEIDRFCEEVLLSSGFAEDAYRRYGLTANRARTNLAWFRAVRKKYPEKAPETVLADLAAATPGEEGKWFAAAKQAGLFDEAIRLVTQAPCDPRTLTRAARDYGEKKPEFAFEAGMAALRWLVEGYGYEITGGDVLDAYSHTMTAAKHAGRHREAQERIQKLLATEAPGGRFVNKMLAGEMGTE